MGHHLDGGLGQCWEHGLGREEEVLLCGILECGCQGGRCKVGEGAPLVSSGYLHKIERDREHHPRPSPLVTNVQSLCHSLVQCLCDLFNVCLPPSCNTHQEELLLSCTLLYLQNLAPSLAHGRYF